MVKGKIVSSSKIERKKGYLYYVDKPGNVREVKMKWASKKSKSKIKE